MGYAQWLELKLKNHTSKTLVIRNLYLHHGKLYRYPDKSKTVSQYTFNDCEIRPGETLAFATCGTENNWAGAEGDFSVMIKADPEERMCQVYWDCPFSGWNKLSTFFLKEGWFVNTPAVDPSGSIGNQTITVFTTTDPLPAAEKKETADMRPTEQLKRAPESMYSVDSGIAV